MDFLLIMLVVVPLLGAGVGALLGSGKAARTWALVVSLATAAVAGILAIEFFTSSDVVGTASAVGRNYRVTMGEERVSALTLTTVGASIHFGLDAIGMWLVLLTVFLMPLAIAASFGSIREREKEYYAWMTMLLGAMLGVFVARDALVFYVFFELTLIPMFFIIGIWGGPERRYAAGKFFLFTFAGSVFTLAAVIYVAMRAGPGGGLSFAIDDIVSFAQTRLSSVERFWVALGLLAGFAIKVPLFPVHTWLPLAHTEAPTAGSVILAGVLLKLGTYGILRLAVPIAFVRANFAEPVHSFRFLWIEALRVTFTLGGLLALLGILCVIAVIYGALVAWVQQDIKKLVAYSSVSHMGFCVLGLVAMNLIGMQGSVLYMINHGLSTGALFLVIGMIYDRYHTRDINELSGLARKMPVLSESRQQARGAMVGVLSWRPFQEIVDEAERYLAKVGLNSGYGFLFDTSGDRVIAHKLRDPDVLPYRNILGQSVSRDFTLPQVAEAARHARGTAFEYDFPPGTRKFAVFAAVDPQNSDQAFAFDWRLGIGVDHSDIFAPLARLRRAAIGATLVLAVAIAGVGVWLGRRLSLSVNEFTHLVHEAAEGRFQLLQASASHDEISELGTALNRLLVSMRQQAELQPVPNPYVVGNPVRTANMFYGRDEDLRWIGDRLSHPGNEIIILYGQRRIGKTSLLHQVRNRRGLTGLQPIFLDTHALVPSIQSDADFYAGIGRAIDAELPSPTGQGATVQSARHLVALLAQLNAAFPNDVVVLLFDEVEALETVVANNTLTSAISSFLSSLLESDVRVSLIVTGSNDGSRLAGPFWSMLTPKAISRRIGLLSRAEGLRLITEPTSGQIDFDDGVPDYVLRYTGAHPYYTQTFCQRLIDTLNERHTRCASRGTVDNVAAQLLAEPPLPLDDMWHNLTPLQRWLMAEIGRLLEGPESTVRADALWINAQATHADPTAIGLELRRLTTIELLEETPTGYRMPVDFIRLWIRHEQLWWQVAREWQAHARR